VRGKSTMSIQTPLELSSFVDNVLQDHQLFHSEFQIDCFITSNSGDHHPWGMYKQVLRELHNRKTAIADNEHSVKVFDISIAECLHKLKKWGWGKKHQFEQQRLVLEIEKLRRSKLSVQQQHREIIRETTRFAEQARQLRFTLGVITEDKRQEYEQDYWLHRLKLRVSAGLLSKNCVPQDVFEMLPGLPTKVRDHLEQHIKNADTNFIKTLNSKKMLELVGA